MKRTLFAALFVLPCLALPAMAETAPAPHHKPKPGHVRTTWQQHFAQANTTKDGHLTAEQAKTGYASLAKHFAEIDTTGKGYVTVEEVAAWHKQQRALHHPAPPNPLRPNHAVHHPTGAPPAVRTSTQGVVPPTKRPTVRDEPG